MRLEGHANLELRERLARLAGEPLLYLPATLGGSGAIPQAAAFQLFADLELKIEPVRKRTVLKDRVILIGGGGSIAPDYDRIPRFIADVKDQARRIIVLPHTIRGCETFLEELGANVEIVCRDATSYAAVLEARSSARAMLGHDLAFSLDIDQLLGDPERVAAAERLLDERVPRTEAERLMEAIGLRFLFRTDGEATRRHHPNGSIDLPQALGAGRSPEDAVVSAAATFVYLDRFREIHTDRLQVAIAAARLGKDVFFYESATGKALPIYRHSIHTGYPKVQFVP